MCDRRRARVGRRRLAALVSVLLPCVCVSAPRLALAWKRGVLIERKHRSGERMVYHTIMAMHATIHTSPATLEAILPPFPTVVHTEQQNTVTVESVADDGATVVKNRFDYFKFQSDLADRAPEALRASTRQTQIDFEQRINGRTLIVHYDRDGHLVSFEGADGALAIVDAPLREPLRELLRLFLEQMSGAAAYPDRRVKPGEEWKRPFTFAASESYPFTAQGESTFRYVGKTRYGGVKAAVIDFEFVDHMKPEAKGGEAAGPLGKVASAGVNLDVQLTGQAKGRLLVALDDGRILQNHLTMQQKLAASLKSLPGVNASAADPISLEVSSEGSMQMDGVNP